MKNERKKGGGDVVETEATRLSTLGSRIGTSSSITILPFMLPARTEEESNSAQRRRSESGSEANKGRGRERGYEGKGRPLSVTYASVQEGRTYTPPTLQPSSTFPRARIFSPDCLREFQVVSLSLFAMWLPLPHTCSSLNA